MGIIDVTLTRFTWMAFHQPTMGRIFACRDGLRRLDCWPSKPAWASRAMLSAYGWASARCQNWRSHRCAVAFRT
jgi:hypothetical protein